jgi:hypothetical protein
MVVEPLIKIFPVDANLPLFVTLSPFGGGAEGGKRKLHLIQ